MSMINGVGGGQQNYGVDQSTFQSQIASTLGPVAQLFGECAGARGMVTQGTHHVTECGTRGVERASESSAQWAVHGSRDQAA